MTTKLDLKIKIDDQTGDLLVSYDGGCTWEIAGQVHGVAGISPHIDEVTGNWFVGEEDTGVPARGPQGEEGNDGSDGAEGTAPYISEDGFWVVNGEKTSVKAVGEYTNIAVDASGIAGSGTPSIVPTREGNTVTLAFNNLKGVKGDKGDTGPQGPTGPQGEQGEQGDPGDGIHFKATRYECLVPNDVYVNSDGDMLVRVTEEGAEGTAPVSPATFDQNVTFINLGNLKGPQGDEGPQGPQGHPMYFTADGAYDSDVHRAIFDIEGANPGDFLIYIGEDESVAPAGQLFKMDDGLDEWDRQIWIDQEFNIKGPKGDILNAEGIIPAFRLVENPGEGSSQLQVSFDNVAWTGIGNLPSKGIVNVRETDFSTPTRRVFRITYTDGTYYDMVFDFSGGAPIESGVVIDFLDSTTDASGDRNISDITETFLDSSYINSVREDHDEVNYSAFSRTEIAQSLISGVIKKATIKVTGTNGLEYVTAYLPASIYSKESDDECLLLGWGVQNTLGCIKDSGSGKLLEVSYQDSVTYKGLSPKLYAVSIRKYNGAYQYAGFTIKNYSPAGIWGIYT